MNKGPFTRQKRRNGLDRNEYRFQQNLTVYTRKFCIRGTDKKMARSSENRGTDKDRLHAVFFETGTDRARDMKLQRLVRMRLRPYLKRLMYNRCILLTISCVSSKEENTNLERINNVSDNSGKCFLKERNKQHVDYIIFPRLNRFCCSFSCCSFLLFIRYIAAKM